MPYLFDASSALGIVVEKGKGALRLLENNYILDLTLYEIGNALWRMHVLLKKLSAEDARSLMEVMMDLAGRMKKIAIAELNPAKTMELAMGERITFYDAAYVAMAKLRGLTLVTDDVGLAKVASKHVKVKSSKGLMARS